MKMNSILRILSVVLHLLSTAYLVLLQYISADYISINFEASVTKEVFLHLFSGSAKIWYIVGAALYAALFPLFPKFILPNRARKKLLKETLRRIVTELLDGDLDKHRITLFRETFYCEALARNIWAFIRHIFHRNRWRSLLYLRPPAPTRYLVIDQRCGLRFEKSTTMFPVELNEKKYCNGIASYIRFKGSKAVVDGLPDISEVDFSKYKNLKEVPKNWRRKVREYMKLGFINNFDTLRKMHHLARHFCGTIILKEDGSVWGVLLIDSTDKNNPFTTPVQERFNAFSNTISGILNMEA